MPKICLNCGHELKHEEKFCSKCGTKYEEQNTVKSKTAKCWVCGCELKPDSQLCPRCGTKCKNSKIEGFSQIRLVFEKAKKLLNKDLLKDKEALKNRLLKNKKLLVGVAAGIAVVIAVAVFMGGKSKAVTSNRLSAGLAEYEQEYKADLEQQIYTLVNGYAIGPWGPDLRVYTLGELISTVFYDYEITWENYNSSVTRYEVTITGGYYPNYTVPEDYRLGDIQFIVDLSENTCEVVERNDVFEAFDTAAMGLNIIN